MSWSLRLLGKVEKVKPEAEKRFATGFTYLQGDEAALKDAAASIVSAALAAQSEGSVVEIDCTGSGGSSGDKKYQSLQIKVNPIYGFVE